VFTQLSFPQGCFRQHDITGWLNATARDAADIMLVPTVPPYVIYYNIFSVIASRTAAAVA
jgi:hypothetical protein